MYPGGYTAEVTSLSPKATESDVYDFFTHCGGIEHVEVIRSGGYACTAYVTFKDAYSLETAVLLSGATIIDQSVCISRWGTYVDEFDPWTASSYLEENSGSTAFHTNQFVSSPGEAVTLTQEVVKMMMAKGYILGKDALVKAKEFDDSYRVSATAAAKVAELSNRLGLTETIYASMEAVKCVDEKFHVSDITKSAATVTGTAALTAATITGRAAVITGRAAVAAGTAAVNSSYFARGSLLLSDVLTRAAKAASDLGSHNKSS